MKLGEMAINEVGKKLVVPFVFFVIAAIITPPDVISQLTLAFEMLIIYVILWFIVSRLRSYAQTPQDIKKLITFFICLLSITIASSLTFYQYYIHINKSYRQLKDEHSKCPISQQQSLTENQ
jgi:predicted membrane protein